LFKKNDLHGIFHEVHRSIEESVTHTVEQLKSDSVEMTYPPNNGFTPAELKALRTIAKTKSMQSALRKLMADAAASPLFHLFCMIDGVADPPELTDIQDNEQDDVELMLHDGFYSSYWAWRRRRPDPGWSLDPKQK
jgi:hypothetical protein